MPKVNQRASTPETPRLKRDTLRRAALYNSNPVGPYLKPKLTAPTDEDTLVRVSNKGIPFAAEKPSAQQMQERDRGFIKSAPNSSGNLGPGWNVGYLNKASVYPTEPHNLLRFGHAGALKMQRGRINKDIVNTEWTPKLVMEPSKAAGDVKGAPGAWPEASAYPTGAIVGDRRQKNESWFAHETSAAPPTIPQPTRGMDVTLPSAEAVLGSMSGAQGITRGTALRSLERLSRTLEREADSERRFGVQLEAARKAQAEVNFAPDADVLAEGLGPEATLKVLRGMASAKKKHGIRSAAAARKKSSEGGGGGGERIVAPKSERRRPRVCGGLSVIVQNSSGMDAGEAMRQAQSTEKQRAQQKWALLGRFHARWFQTARDKKRFGYEGLTTSLAEAARDNADVACVTRDQFASVTLMRLRDMGLAHRLYSSLDGDKGSESLPWILIMLPLTMLAVAQRGQPQQEVLLSGLRLVEAVAPPLTMSSMLAVLGCCCATRMQQLEMQTKAAAGFEFALRAGSAAAEMAATVSGGGGVGGGYGGGGGFGGGEMERRRDKAALDVSGQPGGKGGLTPELVVQVLMEYPDLAADIQKHMHNSFASAGRAMPSLAVIDTTPSDKNKSKGSSSNSKMTQGVTGGGMASSSLAATNAATRTRANGRTGRGWVDDGVASGDRRKSSFIFPSADDESDDDEDEDVALDG